jgi:1-acyl-sn-glycerol-3-phosphate acyltransferase
MVWLYSILFDLVFLTILVAFHPLLALAGVISRELFWRIFIVMNRALVWNLRVCGRTTIIVSGTEHIPHSERPVLVIANHQSMFDIPLLITTFWPRQTRFIAKKELARGVPSVSIGLRLSQAALINRSDRRQAIHEIRAFSQSVGETNGTAGKTG